MFIYGFLLVYLLPNIYVFFRIRSLLINTRQKTVAGILHLLLVLAFPAAEIMSHAPIAASIAPLLIAGYDALPYLLYVFLVVLVIDIVLGINRLLRIMPREKLQQRSVRHIRLAMTMVIPVIIVLWGSAKFSDIRVNHYQIEIPRKSSPLRHLKIALASDFHLKGLTSTHFMEQFVQKVNEEDVDILLIPGDLLEGNPQDAKMDEFERQFRLVQTRFGMYASLGNHDSYGRRISADFYEKSNIRLLRDTVLTVDKAFTLVGRLDSRLDGRKSIAELMHSAPDSLPTIVLDHRPTELEQTSATNADILVSGHTHDGQLFPFNLIAQQIYELSWGYTKIRATNVFVTSGVQLWGPPVRTAGDSEIMIIEVDLVGR